jgi:2-dehydropantoate 2-reductase
MRFVVFGAGAIGGVVGGRLHQAGHDVSLIARGRHLRAVQEGGLVLESPGERVVLDIPAVDGPAGVHWHDDHVVLLTVKSQDTDSALLALEDAAPTSVPVVCMQNGVDNERRALRAFARIYGVCVMLPATHLDPGVVQAHSAPVTGLLDVGCYPAGSDETARELAGALSGATFASVPVKDIMRWKYGKLLRNLLNAAEALCGPAARGGPVAQIVNDEGETVLRAAGIEYVSREEDDRRRGDSLQLGATPSRAWGGGSSWQSLARGTGNVEADYLNGEIALLGRLHGVPTPANATLQRLVKAAAAERVPPGTMPLDELTATISTESTSR